MPKAPTSAVLIARHGETVSNIERRYAGASSEPLTARGREQALLLAERLRSRQLTRVRASRVARATETGALVADALGVPLLLDERLNELCMGPWEGLTEREVTERYPLEFALWQERPDRLRLQGRETLDELGYRVAAVLGDSVACGQREVLVTHVALVRMAILLSADRPFAEYRTIEVPNCHLADVRVAGQVVAQRIHRPSDPGLRRVIAV